MLDKEYLIEMLHHYKDLSKEIGNIYCAGSFPKPPKLAYQTHFPRIEMILFGELEMTLGSTSSTEQRKLLKQSDVIYFPSESWNYPHWNKAVVTLTLMAGKQSFGLSLLSWDGKTFDSAIKENIPRRGPRVGAFILNALKELTKQVNSQSTMKLLISSLFSHIVDLIEKPAVNTSKSHALFVSVREYLEQHYQKPLTRESVAECFYVSPNYLSQLFQKEGNIKFNEYLNLLRLEHAKLLLLKYDMKVKEIAHHCGFKDSNYFCRIFKAQTQRSPSKYRAQSIGKSIY